MKVLEPAVFTVSAEQAKLHRQMLSLSCVRNRDHTNVRTVVPGQVSIDHHLQKLIHKICG